ncbi:hypothetical protein, partial [Caballeronia sp. EK]|uniref:hypothetical protein n=1 Tax=Caballeronia sp. EK TaxID=2767469 RepID=UPI001CA3CF3B
GCWVLGVGCWVLGVGCWVLGVGCWVLGVGCWVLGVGCWVLGVGCKGRLNELNKISPTQENFEFFEVSMMSIASRLEECMHECSLSGQDAEIHAAKKRLESLKKQMV